MTYINTMLGVALGKKGSISCLALRPDRSIALFSCSCGQKFSALDKKCDAVEHEKVVPAGRRGTLD